jgi:tRNA threonylcarbamoyladenosine modification (KEOPS) complex  Pcc1 subunit
MVSAPHTAEVTLPCGSPVLAGIVRAAIQAETDEAPEGASCRLSVDGSDLRASLAAADVAGLRAALNTVVRLADAALRTAGGPAGAGLPPGQGRN